MDRVQRVRTAENRTELTDAANRVYLSLGRGPDLNAAAIDDMRSFLDTAAHRFFPDWDLAADMCVASPRRSTGASS